MTAPAALLLVSPTCPYCPGMKHALAELEQRNKIAQLEIVDITEQPEVAERLGVRSVPWLQLGELVFEGAHTAGELEKWAATAASANGLTEYFEESLGSGQLALVERMINQQPDRLHALLPLVADPEIEMSVRIGIAALFEAHAGSTALAAMADDLAALCDHINPTVRADACHLLIQTRSPRVAEILSRLQDDADPQVREIARDGLDELNSNG